jgi:hypothetical protein
MTTERVCVVYDASSGEVRHLQRSVALSGAQVPPDREIEARALEIAERLSEAKGVQLKALHVDASSLRPHARHRVDLKTLTVVAEPLPR